MLGGIDALATLTRLVRQVKHPDLVRRCFTCSPGTDFRRTLGGFVVVIVFAVAIVVLGVVEMVISNIAVSAGE